MVGAELGLLVTGSVQAAANVASAAADVLKLWGDSPISNRTSSDDVKEVRDKLDTSIGRLRAKMKDYEKEVEQKKKEQSETFKQWIKDVLDLEDQVNKLVKYDEESEESSSNCSEEVKKKLDEVNELLEHGNQIKDQLMVDRQLKSVVMLPAPCIEKIQMFQGKLMDVLKLLGNDKVNGIRISGMIGVGKTTVMLNLNNHNEVAESFDVVIWVNVSKEDGDKKDLQRQILERLEKESTEDTDANARRISETLMDKKYLLLLDDVKEDLSLDEIGIPYANKGSKVVLTTRRNEVCSSLVNRVVNVEPLPVKDALEMFQGILEDPEFHKSPTKYFLARKVVNDCHYIPLLIEQIARTIKQKIRVEESEFILQIGRNFPLFLEKESNDRIEVYYNLLKGFYYGQMGDDVQKKCFLFGALYPEGSRIYVVHLMECLRALYFNGNDNEKTLAVSNTLQDLTNLSLLEESEDDCVTMEKTVIMRRFIRKMALYCASSGDPECDYLFKTDEDLQESPDAQLWRNKHYVSLSQNEFDRLPLIPDCSDLSTLLLQINLNLKEIPDSFFQYMKKLKILDMCQTGIESLPSSISDLNLKVLYLRDCQSLEDLNFAMQLPLLEALDIRGSKIILTRTKNLERLRRLWISFEKCSVQNGTEVRLSQLSALEELVIHMESFDQWKNDEVLIRDIIKEVASLEKLRSLEFRFRDEKKVINVIKYEPIVEMLEVYVPHVAILQIFIAQSCLFSREKSFLFFIGCPIPEDPHFPATLGYEKYIKYCDGEGTDPPIPEVLATVEAFELIDHKDIVQLSDFGRVDHALSNLQHLHLKDLPNLTNIWSEPGECGSLVKTLVLSGCPMLTTIFPAKIIQQLHNMESLTVENCSGAVKIFEKFENDGTGLNQLPNLKDMVLKELPNLENIWSEPEECGCLVELKTLVLSGCPMLTTIFPAKIIQQLCHMESLTVENCSGAVKIFEKFENDGNGLNQLPNLKEMVLKELPNLENIWADESSKCQFLKKLTHVNCPGIVGKPVEINAPNLEHW